MPEPTTQTRGQCESKHDTGATCRLYAGHDGLHRGWIGNDDTDQTWNGETE